MTYRVKDLEWREYGEKHFVADSPFGNYRISPVPTTEAFILVKDLKQIRDTTGNFKMTLDTAKSIAYFDHTQEIVNLLEVIE